MKLEVGMYCYNKTNRKLGIGKIIDFQYNNNVNIRYKNDIELVSIGNVIANFNIIDILEIGDILVDDTNRKLEVLLIDNELMVRNAGLIYDNNYYLPIKSIAIKSVITHEQMEQMAYKVGE